MTELLAPLILMGGYFLNGGVGLMMQPASQGGAPPTGAAITTQGGTPIVSQGGSTFVTG